MTDRPRILWTPTPESSEDAAKLLIALVRPDAYRESFPAHRGTTIYGTYDIQITGKLGCPSRLPESGPVAVRVYEGLEAREHSPQNFSKCEAYESDHGDYDPFPVSSPGHDYTGHRRAEGEGKFFIPRIRLGVCHRDGGDDIVPNKELWYPESAGVLEDVPVPYVNFEINGFYPEGFESFVRTHLLHYFNQGFRTDALPKTRWGANQLRIGLRDEGHDRNAIWLEHGEKVLVTESFYLKNSMEVLGDAYHWQEFERE